MNPVGPLGHLSARRYARERRRRSAHRARRCAHRHALRATRAAPRARTPHSPARVDARDSAGYAIRELWIGTRSGRLDRRRAASRHDSHDAEHHLRVVHRPVASRQRHRSRLSSSPASIASSAAGSRISLPMMIPVPVLFSTPEDGANELRFLRASRLRGRSRGARRRARRAIRHARGFRLALSALGDGAARGRRRASRSEVRAFRVPRIR